MALRWLTDSVLRWTAALSRGHDFAKTAWWTLLQPEVVCSQARWRRNMSQWTNPTFNKIGTLANSRPSTREPLQGPSTSLVWIIKARLESHPY